MTHSELRGRRSRTARRLHPSLRCIVGLSLLPAISSGQELIGGWEGNTSRGYGFVSPVLSAGVGGPHAILLRGTGSYLYYRFPNIGGSTDVTSPGISGALGYRVRAGRVSAALGAGYEMRWTVRRPAVGSSSRLTEHGFTMQGELFFQATPLTNVNAIVSYGDANRYVWARTGVKRQLTNTHFRGPVAFSVGAEGTAQGNHDARAYQAGALIALDFLRLHGSLQCRGGYTRLQYPDGSAESQPYLGLGLYQAF